MSETNTPTKPALPPVKVEWLPDRENGRDREKFVVTFGSPERKIEGVRLSLGEEFDLAELTGKNSDNVGWMNMAYVAASVRVIDGMPTVTAKRKEQLSRTLDAIGMAGFKAVSAALTGPSAEPEQQTREAYREVAGG